MSGPSTPLDRLAAACAARLPPAPRTFDEDRTALAHELDALVAAVRDLHGRYAFDADGRPDALAAIRRALPAMEAELLDAVLEDVACELAAQQEALYRVALACRRTPACGNTASRDGRT